MGSLCTVSLHTPCVISSLEVRKGKSERGEQGERGQRRPDSLGTVKRKTTSASSSHPVSSLACEEQLLSPHLLSFRNSPMIAPAPTNLPILFPPLIGGYFTTFFSWWKSSLCFVCPAINFSCFNTSPYFHPGNPLGLNSQSILLGIENSGSWKPSLAVCLAL